MPDLKELYFQCVAVVAESTAPETGLVAVVPITKHVATGAHVIWVRLVTAGVGAGGSVSATQLVPEPEEITAAPAEDDPIAKQVELVSHETSVRELNAGVGGSVSVAHVVEAESEKIDGPVAVLATAKHVVEARHATSDTELTPVRPPSSVQETDVAATEADRITAPADPCPYA